MQRVLELTGNAKKEKSELQRQEAELKSQLADAKKLAEYKTNIADAQRAIADAETSKRTFSTLCQIELKREETDHDYKLAPLKQKAQYQHFCEIYETLYKKNSSFLSKNFVAKHQSKSIPDFIAKIQSELQKKNKLVEEAWKQASNIWDDVRDAKSESKAATMTITEIHEAQQSYKEKIAAIIAKYAAHIKDAEEEIIAKQKQRLEALEKERTEFILKHPKVEQFEIPALEQNLKDVQETMTYQAKTMQASKEEKSSVKSLAAEEKKAEDPEITSLATAFRGIYQGLRDGQTGSDKIKTDFLATRSLLSNYNLVQQIKLYVISHPDSRTAKAWKLAQAHHENFHNDNHPLFFGMYKCAFEASGPFKKSQIWGHTFFKYSSFSTDVTQFTAQEVKRARESVGTRGHKILNHLPAPKRALAAGKSN